MQLAALCTDPFVICCTFLCLLLHLALRSLNPNSASGRRLPPGPRGVPLLGALPLVGPAPHSGLAALARKYGPVMYLRMGTCGVVVASSPSAARTFLKALDERFANRPAVASAADITYGCQNMVFANYGPKWKLMRKLASVHLLGADHREQAGVRRAGRRVQQLQGDDRVAPDRHGAVQHQRLRAGAVVAGPAGRAGQAAPGPQPVRRAHHEAAGGARGNGRGARPGGPPRLRGQAPCQQQRRRRGRGR